MNPAINTATANIRPGLFELGAIKPAAMINTIFKITGLKAVAQKCFFVFRTAPAKAVSEINKSAMKEGMGVSSTKGSFRTAYNANKLLSLIPRRSITTGELEALDLRCEANRERENLKVRLILDNVRIKHEAFGNA